MKDRNKNTKKQVPPNEFTARVKCACGWWINVTGVGTIEPCWKCNGQVRFFLSGSHPVGEAMGFMTFEWKSTQASAHND